MQMKFSGRKARPALLIVRGKGPFRGAAFDISGGKPVEMPEGEYTIDYGRVIQGKGKRVMMADIFAGDSQPIQVKAGENTVVELGAPFHIVIDPFIYRFSDIDVTRDWRLRSAYSYFRMDFEASKDQDAVVVDSVKFKVKGKGGEHYARIVGGVPAPEVLYGKAKDGKGAKVVGEYTNIVDADTLNKTGDTMKAAGLKIEATNPGFFAIVKGDRECSTKLKFTPRFEGGHVGLRQKKHKLFGKLEPNFK